MVRATALDVAAGGTRINAVAPGGTVTAMTFRVRSDPDLSAALLRRIPMQRLAESHEQAEAIWFLASAAASYVTGTVLAVDGGIGAKTGLLPLPAPRE